MPETSILPFVEAITVTGPGVGPVFDHAALAATLANRVTAFCQQPEARLANIDPRDITYNTVVLPFGRSSMQLILTAYIPYQHTHRIFYEV